MKWKEQLRRELQKPIETYSDYLSSHRSTLLLQAKEIEVIILRVEAALENRP